MLCQPDLAEMKHDLVELRRAFVKSDRRAMWHIGLICLSCHVATLLMLTLAHG